MHLCYIDESGTTDAKANTSHFVLLGFAVPADVWIDKDRGINKIKSKFGLSNTEIHTGYLTRRYPDQEKIPNFDALDYPARREAVTKKREEHLIKTAALKTDDKLKTLKKVYRMTSPYIHLSFLQRRALLDEIADEVASWKDVRLFAEAVDKHEFGMGGVIFNQAFEQVVTRFHTYLSIRENERQKFDPGHSTRNLGLLIQDNNDTVKKHLTDLMRKFHNEGTVWSKIPQIIETPLFVDSSLTSMIQIADFCAYVTRRYFENQETALFNKILPCFDKKGGRLVGIRHFSSKHCPCVVCKRH